MNRFVLCAFSLLILSSCASVVDGQIQKVTMLTPGAENAVCTLDNGTVKYSIISNQTIELTKSDNDLIAHCYAPGNRELTKIVEWDFNPWTAGNVVTGVVPGVAYDHFYKGLYEYPAVITMDFTSIPVKPYDFPQHYAPGLDNPNYAVIESYDPTSPKTEADKYKVSPILKKKDRSALSSNPITEAPNSSDSPTPLSGSGSVSP